MSQSRVKHCLKKKKKKKKKMAGSFWRRYLTVENVKFDKNKTIHMILQLFLVPSQKMDIWIDCMNSNTGWHCWLDELFRNRPPTPRSVLIIYFVVGLLLLTCGASEQFVFNYIHRSVLFFLLHKKKTNCKKNLKKTTKKFKTIWSDLSTFIIYILSASFVTMNVITRWSARSKMEGSGCYLFCVLDP